MRAQTVVRSPSDDATDSRVVSIEAIGRQRLARFVSALETALADPVTNRGVLTAGVVVRLELTDLPGRSVHLLFKEAPASITQDRSFARPDARLVLGSGDLECFLAEGQELPLRILSGAIEFEGQVRKLLRVLPILRAATVPAQSAAAAAAKG